MRLPPALAFLCLFARASAQPLGPASIAQPVDLATGTTTDASAVPAASTAEAETLTQNSRTLLDAQDRKTALSQAEAAVQAGGGADAYAARADAELALGQTDGSLLDYAEAARRDPARYAKKYRELLARLRPHGEKSELARGRTPGGRTMIFIRVMGAAGVLLLVVAVLLLRRKGTVGKSGSEL